MNNRISKEWARQLAWETWPGYIVSTTTINYVDDHEFSYHVPIPTLTNFSIIPWQIEFEVEEIYLISVYDPINKEITRLGHGPKSNLVLVGSTRKAVISTNKIIF